MQEARTMLLKGVALWLPSCRQGKKEEKKEMERWEEEEKEGRKDVGASASVLTPANMGEEEVWGSSHSWCVGEGGLFFSQVVTMPPYSSRISCAKLLLELGEYDVSLTPTSLVSTQCWPSLPPLSPSSQKAFEVLERLLCEDDEVVGVWYLMGWLHYLTADRDSALFYLEQTEKVGDWHFCHLHCDIQFCNIAYTYLVLLLLSHFISPFSVYSCSPNWSVMKKKSWHTQENC